MSTMSTNTTRTPAAASAKRRIPPALPAATYLRNADASIPAPLAGALNPTSTSKLSLDSAPTINLRAKTTTIKTSSQFRRRRRARRLDIFTANRADARVARALANAPIR